MVLSKVGCQVEDEVGYMWWVQARAEWWAFLNTTLYSRYRKYCHMLGMDPAPLELMYSCPRLYWRFSGPNLGRGLGCQTIGRSCRMARRFEHQKEKDGVTNIKGNGTTGFRKFIKHPPRNKYIQAELRACVPVVFWTRLVPRHVERCCLLVIPCTVFPSLITCYILRFFPDVATMNKGMFHFRDTRITLWK
jgi:hypothetical protein